MTLQGWYGPDKLLRNYKKLIILSMEGLGKNSRASFQKLLDEVANCKKKNKKTVKNGFLPPKKPSIWNILEAPSPQVNNFRCKTKKQTFGFKSFKSPLPPKWCSGSITDPISCLWGKSINNKLSLLLKSKISKIFDSFFFGFYIFF